MNIFFKILQESILLAVQELRVNKLRTFLSLLGITVGIFSIISVFTVVDTMESKVRGSVEKLGSNVLYIQKWPWSFGSEYPWWKYWKRPVPNSKELKIIQDKVKTAESACIIFHLGRKIIKYKKNNVENLTIVSASHDYDKIRELEFEKGRYFSFSESQSGLNVVIIGNDIAMELFPDYVDPIGEVVTIMDMKYTVIGVFKKEGEDPMNNSMDKMVMIPFFNLVQKIDEKRSEPFIMAKAKSNFSVEELNDEIKGVMRSIRKLRPMEEDDFALNQISMLAQPLNMMFNVINVAGWLIGGFSILVGGFGIANIMFVSVKERTNIIGIKKALGAKQYIILLEFLIEAIILCFIGGALGIFLVYLETLISLNYFEFEIFLTFNNIMTGINISLSIGLISGFWPALSASRMDPVEAIRQN